MDQPAHEFDVVIIGGALSGGSTAICLLQDNPKLRILIIERSEAFKRRVGEATVEVGAYFLTRVLGLTDHMNRKHLIKQGFRFWFGDDPDTPLDQCSEIGAKYLTRVVSFQVDRPVLDQHVLDQAQALGAQLWRPAQVQSVELNDAAQQHLTIRRDQQEFKVSARWVVDASGVAAMLSRQLGHWQRNEQHPINAVWSRWTGVKNWDDAELARQYPKWSRACYGMRNTATNHLMGDGWWAWWIPLRSGDVSIGVVYDQRLFQWPTDGSLANQLHQVICSNPAGKQMLADGQCVEDDVHLRKNLAYKSEVYAGDGYVLVGDAAAFLDPFYSPGIDWIAFTAIAATRLIQTQQKSEPLEARIEKHNKDMVLGYERAFHALYHDKYELMGDYDLMRITFTLDLGLYYLGVVSDPYKKGIVGLEQVMFTRPGGGMAFNLMRAYKRRLVSMAQVRRARGMLGCHNTKRRFLLDGYTFSPWSYVKVLWALMGWMRLELTEGWRSWFGRPAPKTVPPPSAKPTTASAANEPQTSAK